MGSFPSRGLCEGLWNRKNQLTAIMKRSCHLGGTWWECRALPNTNQLQQAIVCCPFLDAYTATPNCSDFLNAGFEFSSAQFVVFVRCRVILATSHPGTDQTRSAWFLHGGCFRKVAAHRTQDLALMLRPAPIRVMKMKLLIGYLTCGNRVYSRRTSLHLPFTHLPFKIFNCLVNHYCEISEYRQYYYLDCKLLLLAGSGWDFVQRFQELLLMRQYFRKLIDK